MRYTRPVDPGAPSLWVDESANSQLPMLQSMAEDETEQQALPQAAELLQADSVPCSQGTSHEGRGRAARGPAPASSSGFTTAVGHLDE